MQAITEDVAVAAIIEITSILGLVFNGLGFLIALKDPLLKNTFGRLCLNHCAGNFGYLLIFVIWVTPLTLTQNTPLALGIFGKIAGQLCAFFWDVVLYSHVLVSVDRLLSIALPTRRGCLLACFQPRVMTILPWIMASASVGHFFAYGSCYSAYYPARYQFRYGDTPCGRKLAGYHYCRNCALVGIMIVVDIVTLFFLRKRHKMIRRRSFNEENARKMSTSHRRSETCFFIQTAIEGLLFFVTLFTGYILTHWNFSILYRFFTITFHWLLFHGLDGLIMCIFQLIRRRRRSKPRAAKIFVMLT